MLAVQTREANIPRILITEPIAQEGIDLLRYELPEAHIDVRLDLSPEHLLALIGSYTALIIRSQTRVTGELLAEATRLQVIGRAGSGLDNIDLDAAIRHGVLVVQCAQRECDCGCRTYYCACCWRWHDTFPLPIAASKQAGGTRAACWVSSYTARCLASSVWERSARRWHE